MKNTFRLSLLAAAALFSSQSFAESPNWDFLELNYLNQEFDTLVEPKGLEVKGVRLLTDDIFLKGSLQVTGHSMLNDDFDYQTLDLGLGYKLSLYENTDWWASASLIRMEAESNHLNIEENGFALATGVRSMLTDDFELSGEISYANLNRDNGIEYLIGSEIQDDNHTTATLQGTYYLTENLGLNLGYQYSSDLKGYKVGVRYAF